MKWASIPSWEHRYEISEYGDVRSKDMVVNARNGATAIRKGRLLTKVRKANGYLCVTLTDGVNRPQVSIHRLVARTFIGECPLGLHVLHCDGDKTNNHFGNLRYGTPADNVDDTKRHGRQRYGRNHPRAKLDEDAVAVIRTSSRPAPEIAAWFGVSKAHVSAIRRRRVWQHVHP